MYELEGVVFITDNRGRPQIVHGIVDRTREVEQIVGLDTLLGQGEYWTPKNHSATKSTHSLWVSLFVART